MNTRSLDLLPLGLITLLVAACGAAGPATSVPEAVGSGAAAATSAPAQALEATPQSGGPAPSAGMDISTVDLCAVLPRAELASLAGGTPYDGNDPGGQACIYTIDPGDGTAELYALSITTPDATSPLIDYVRQYEQAEWPEGIGDVAYLQSSDLDDGFDLVVLVEGRYGLSISGPRPEVLQAAARLILERVGE